MKTKAVKLYTAVNREWHRDENMVDGKYYWEFYVEGKGTGILALEQRQNNRGVTLMIYMLTGDATTITLKPALWDLS